MRRPHLYSLGKGLVAITLLVLMGWPLSPPQPHVWGVLWDYLHFPLWAILSWLLLRRTGKRAGGRLAIGLLLLLAVLLIEWLQRFTGRQSDLHDVLMGWAGVLCVWLWSLRASTTQRRVRIWAGCLLIGFFAAAHLYLSVTLYDVARMVRQFPVLSDFGRFTEGDRWHINSAHAERANVPGFPSRPTLRLELLAELEYPGAFLTRLIPDWSAYSAVALEIYVEGDEPLSGWVRLDDLPGNPPYTDRFDQEVLLNPGGNMVWISLEDLRTPGGRNLDLKRIHTIGLLFTRDNAGRVIHLVRVFLTDGSDRKYFIMIGVPLSVYKFVPCSYNCA